MGVIESMLRHRPAAGRRSALALAAALLFGTLRAAAVPEAGDPPVSQLKPPATVSEAWQAAWPAMAIRGGTPVDEPAPDDLAGWTARQAQAEAVLGPRGDQAAQFLKLSVQRLDLGGVPVLQIDPPGWHNDGRILIYLHGGGFTSQSARSTQGNAGLMATYGSLRVISVDYTLAPQARWQRIGDQVVAVYRALLRQGYRPQSIGVWGDSAGGALAAGAVLKLRDQNLPLPAAVVLWSPWSDLSGSGDSYDTLAAADPLLQRSKLASSAAAYADPADQRQPYVSPVYGDYRKGFPPTLIQGGTREIFLSNCVRLYQAMSAAGVRATLDLYEGMPHVFQILASQTPEAQQAMRKVQAFWNVYLQPGKVTQS